MRYAFVTPRYGAEVIGGAELGARMLAERLARLPGWEVEVLTTCALDAWTWANHFEPGERVEEGVRVRRFPVDRPRHPDFHRRTVALLNRPERVPDDVARQWIDWQGPVSGALLDAIERSDADLLAFYPYLYHPTVEGLPRAGRARAVMHPAAHSEPAIHLPLFRSVFAAAGAFVFQTEGERELTERLFPEVVAAPQALIGLGYDEPPAGALAAPVDLDGRPYVLCLGRVDHSKGTHLLASWFARYKERHPGPLALAVVGPVQRELPPHPDVVVVGPVDEAAKWSWLAGATVLCSPSAYEAFSLVVIEAWAAGVPVLVNGRCAPTREHAVRSGGGLWFDGYAQFEVALERLTGDKDLRAALADAGAAYAEQYRWPVVIDRYRRFAESLLARGAPV